MKIRLIQWFVLAAVMTVIGGCFSGPGNTPTDAECGYRCAKCGKRVLMLNTTLRSQPCPEGGRHQWRHQVR